jgi:3-hydroxyacyl-[acyl-carrier-protein] dehydratase
LTTFDASEIQRLIPHRYPFLLIDRVLELEPGKRVVGVKSVTANEPFFQGHFPGYPIMPGVLVLEALAQAGAVLLLSDERQKDKLPLFAGIDRCRFRRPVVPGDQLRLEIEFTMWRGPIGRGRARATVEGAVAAEAELIFSTMPAPTVGGEVVAHAARLCTGQRPGPPTATTSKIEVSSGSLVAGEESAEHSEAG